MNWTNTITLVGVAIAAIAAITGLWFQAVATYWSQQTAKDQLDHSKEDDLKEERAQASRVTYWEEFTDDGPDIHVVNRSLDPVTTLFLDFTFILYGVAVEGNVTAPVDLPPCTERVYRYANMHGEDNDGKIGPLWNTSAVIARIYFVDGHGRFWARDRTSLTQKRPPATTLRSTRKPPVTEVKPAPTKKVENCGSPTD
ncbi:hypothetical protein [Streptomyces sp. NPDC001089]